jgi:hypothetical protein
MYTLAGFTINTAEQARTILLMAMLKQDQPLAAKAHWVLKKLGGA